MSADTLVPDPSNPQSLNRFAYTIGNPLRFVDPTGYYSEEEIVQAFEVKTWDEVLDLFRPDGILEGLWGWLEVLRRANDGDMVVYGTIDGMNNGPTSISGSPGNVGLFRRDKAGRIFVGNEKNSGFAAKGRDRVYSLFRRDSASIQTLAYWVPSTQIHTHLKWKWVGPDPQAALADLSSAGLDVVGDFCIANVELAPVSTLIGVGALAVGFLVDLGAAEEAAIHIATYRHSGRYDSGQVLDVMGVFPEVGIFSDLISSVSNLSGVKLEATP
jgi:hypothetical protein